MESGFEVVIESVARTGFFARTCRGRTGTGRLSREKWNGCFSGRAAASERGRDLRLLRFFGLGIRPGQQGLHAHGAGGEKIVISAFADDRRKRQLAFAAGAIFGRRHPVSFKNLCAGRVGRLERFEQVARLLFQKSQSEKNHDARDRGKSKNLETPVQHERSPAGESVVRPAGPFTPAPGSDCRATAMPGINAYISAQKKPKVCKDAGNSQYQTASIQVKGQVAGFFARHFAMGSRRGMG